MAPEMTLLSLVLSNLWSKKGRSVGIAAAVAVAVMTVVTLTVVSQGLEASATNILRIGKADFSVAQKLGLHVGSRFHANGAWNTVVGIFSTGVSFGDLAGMFPLPALQAYNRVPGALTVFFVKTDPGASIPAVEARITHDHPQLTTIRSASQFGRVDRTLVYLQAAVTGSTVLAILIGAIVVGNTMLLSLFERTREFGLMRAVGWSRLRIVALVVGEGIVLALVGSAVGVAVSFLVANGLENLPQLAGILQVSFTASAFLRGLYTGLGMSVIGALYPAIRAVRLIPLRALSHE